MHFAELVASCGWRWAVGTFEGKFVGVTGPGYDMAFG